MTTRLCNPGHLCAWPNGLGLYGFSPLEKGHQPPTQRNPEASPPATPNPELVQLNARVQQLEIQVGCYIYVLANLSVVENAQRGLR